MTAYIPMYSLKHFWKKPVYIDILLAFVFILFLCLSYKYSDAKKGFDFSSFFLNVSAGVLTIWITVRVIDGLIKKRERLKQARETFFKNLKYPFDFVNKVYRTLDERDLAHLKRETKWFEKKWSIASYVTILRENEDPIARKLMGLNMQLLTDIENVVVGRRIEANAITDKEAIMKWRIKNLDDRLNEIEAELDKLIAEVWKTDKPVTL
jgi:hypothetical protein